MSTERHWLDQYVAVATNYTVKETEVMQKLTDFVRELNDKLRGFDVEQASFNRDTKRVTLPNGDIACRINGGVVTLKAVFDNEESREVIIRNQIRTCSVETRSGIAHFTDVNEAIDYGLSNILVAFDERY